MALLAVALVATTMAFAPKQAEAVPWSDGTYSLNSYWDFGTSTQFNDPNHIVYDGNRLLPFPGDGLGWPVNMRFTSYGVSRDRTPDTYVNARLLTSTMTQQGIVGGRIEPGGPGFTIECDLPDGCPIPSNQYVLTHNWTAMARSGPCQWERSFGNPPGPPCPEVEISGASTRTVIGSPPPPNEALTPTCEITSQLGPGGSELSFSSDVETEEEGYLQEWTFSDGTTSRANLVAKVATKPGPFSGTFRAWRPDGEVDESVTCTAEVEAPELGVSVQPIGPDGQPLSDDHVLRVNDVVDVRLRVSADSDGVGALSGLTSMDERWLVVTGAAELAAEPELPEPFSLEPGEHRDVVFRYRITQAGALRFAAAIQGMDAIERLVQADGEARENVGGIDVSVDISYPEPPGGSTRPAEFQRDNNDDGVVDDRDHIVTVEVTASNLLDEPLTDVHATNEDEPVNFVSRLLGDGAPGFETIPGEDYSPDFGSLAANDENPGGADTTKKTYKFLVNKGVNADARVSLRGDAEGGLVVGGFGEARARMDSYLALEVKLDMQDRPYRSGQVVRIDGTLQNLNEDKEGDDGSIEAAKAISVLLTPITEGNAGNGYINGPQVGATPLAADPFIILPGETVTAGGILATKRAKVDSNASVHYLVQAWELSDDPLELATEIDATRIDVVEEGEFSAEHSTSLAADPILPDDDQECETTQLDAVISCNLWVGLRTTAYGLKDLVGLVGSGIATGTDAYQRIVLWEVQMMRDTIRAISGDPAAQQALITELEVQFGTWVAAGIMSREAIDAVGNAFVGFMNEAQEVAERGDYLEIAAYTSRFLGENPDLGLTVLTKVRMMRSLRLAAIADDGAYTAAVTIAREANEKAAREAQEGILARVRQSIDEGKNPAESGVFRGGEDVTDLPQVYQGVAGARTVDVANALKISKAEEVLIAFRSRSPISAKLIDDAVAWLKPMDVKAKTVNVIDTYYLGFRKSALGKVELTAPPIDFRLAAPGREAEFTAALDAHMDKLANTFPEIASDPLWRDEVRARLKLRTKEYPKELANFKRYAEDGVVIEFGYGEQGLPRSLDRGGQSIRKAEVTAGKTTDPFGVEREYFELKMEGPGGGDLRWITGDIDIVAILNPDRTLLLDATKRKRIYDSLRELLGMQHGETLTYINKEVQAKLLRDHVPNADGTTVGIDTLFVAGSDGRLRTGFLEERVSSSVNVLDEVVERPTFHLLTGGPAELVSRSDRGTKAVIDSYETTWKRLQATTVLLAPGKTGALTDGLTGEQIDEFFDRVAKVIRADGKGGLETYELTDGGIEGDVADVQAAAAFGVVSPDAAGLLAIDAVLLDATEAGIDLEQPVGTSGPGALGGRWTPISVPDALAPGDPNLLSVAPITSLTADSSAGASSVEVATAAELAMNSATPWFRAGDVVVVDPGGPAEEKATVAALGSLVFSSPLTKDHPAGTQVVLLAPDDVVTTPTTPTTPIGPTTPTTPAPPARPGNPLDPGGSLTPTDPGATASPTPGEQAGIGSETLPRTGSESGNLVAWGVAAVLAGACTLRLRARSRRGVSPGPA